MGGVKFAPVRHDLQPPAIRKHPPQHNSSPAVLSLRQYLHLSLQSRPVAVKTIWSVEIEALLVGSDRFLDGGGGHGEDFTSLLLPRHIVARRQLRGPFLLPTAQVGGIADQAQHGANTDVLRMQLRSFRLVCSLLPAAPSI